MDSDSAVYEGIGIGYSRHRREDPRIACAIWAALGHARSVVNVGAGTGAYEPRDRRVVAVEPSAVMLAQRPAGAARAIRASAEDLPFNDRTFDSALVVLSLHHWGDRYRGLTELRRVARHSAVFFLRDPSVAKAERWWLHEYFPATGRLVKKRETPLSQIESVLGSLNSDRVPIPWDCKDGFEAAYWRRPEAILEESVWRASSALALINADERERGLQRLRRDLKDGTWRRRWGHLYELDEFDLGYRVVTARFS